MANTPDKTPPPPERPVDTTPVAKPGKPKKVWEYIKHHHTGDGGKKTIVNEPSRPPKT